MAQTTSRLQTDVAIGVVANAASARDLRRIVARAGSLSTSDRANILLRLLGPMKPLGVDRVLLMPDGAGVGAMLARHLEGAHAEYPRVEFLDMPVRSTVEDSIEAVRRTCAAGVALIAVLGGDGTHRAVVRELLRLGHRVPVVALSTGTNNAFAQMREATLAGVAAALYASGRIPRADALSANKLLEVADVAAGRSDIALVDVALSRLAHTGARAIWEPEDLQSVFLSFGEAEAIGLSSIGGLLRPVGRRERHGLFVRFAPARSNDTFVLRAPIVPGRLCELHIAGWEVFAPDRPLDIESSAGVIALDGERELPIESGARLQVRLREDAFDTLDVPACLRYAAQRALLPGKPASAVPRPSGAG